MADIPAKKAKSMLADLEMPGETEEQKKKKRKKKEEEDEFGLASEPVQIVGSN